MNKKVLGAFAAEVKSCIDDAKTTKDVRFDHMAQRLALAVCKVASHFNPRFDEARFRKACGL
jgi:hypothetical protein